MQNAKNKFAQFLTLLQYIKVFLPRFFMYPSKSFKRKSVLEQSLTKQGYAVIHDFMSNDEALELGAKVENLIYDHQQKVNSKDDSRIFGAENLLQELNIFKHNESFQKLSTFVNHKEIKCRYVMVNLLQSGKFGSSGQGWHRDAFGAQFKAIIYLSDVTEKNGPFEIIPKSHKLISIMKLVGSGFLKFKQNRISDGEMLNVQSKIEKSVQVCGKAGTVIIFNSTTIHRGHPILSGKRIAATNYYLPEDFVDEVIVATK